MLRLTVVLVLLVAVLSVGSYATTVTVSQVKLASSSGTLTYVYFESSVASTTSTPKVNTATSIPVGTGSTSISRGSTDSLWSTQFTSAGTVAAGVWVIDFWAKGATKGSMTVSIYITNSAGAAQTTVANAVSTPSLTTTKGEAALTVSGSAFSIPADGYIEVSFTAPSGTSNPTSFTLYWGSGQATNFQVPMSVVSS